MIEFHCPACGQQYTIPEIHGGKNIDCLKCRTRLTIPQAPQHDATPEKSSKANFQSVPWHCRFIGYYAIPVKALSLIVAAAMALLPCFVGTLPFVIARDITAMTEQPETPRYTPSHTTSPPPAAKKRSPTMLSPLWPFTIFVLTGIAYYAFLAAALLWTWMWVDYVQIHTGKINWRTG
jgi:hypothetical protein